VVNTMYRSGPNFEFVEKHVPKWYVPKWSCTDLALTRIHAAAAALCRADAFLPVFHASPAPAEMR